MSVSVSTAAAAAALARPVAHWCKCEITLQHTMDQISIYDQQVILVALMRENQDIMMLWKLEIRAYVMHSGPCLQVLAKIMLQIRWKISRLFTVTLAKDCLYLPDTMLLLAMGIVR